MSLVGQAPKPLVVTLVGPTHEETLDDVDPALQARLASKVRLISAAEAFARPPGSPPIEGAVVGNHGHVDTAVLERLGKVSTAARSLPPRRMLPNKPPPCPPPATSPSGSEGRVELRSPCSRGLRPAQPLVPCPPICLRCPQPLMP